MREEVAGTERLQGRTGHLLGPRKRKPWKCSLLLGSCQRQQDCTLVLCTSSSLEFQGYKRLWSEKENTLNGSVPSEMSNAPPWPGLLL